MLKVFRIANPLYIFDKSGQGARLHGGRWNAMGTPVLYTASSIALAAWEVRVHLPNNIVPRSDAFSLAFIHITSSSVCDVTGLKDVSAILITSERSLFSKEILGILAYEDH